MRAANFYKGDPFHIWKYGIGRHFVGSCLVTLAQWGFWPGREQGFDDLMHRAYADFKWSCKHEMRATPHLKSFTRQHAAFPWFGCKGGDTMLLARWLLRVLRHGVKLVFGTLQQWPGSAAGAAALKYIYTLSNVKFQLHF